MASLLRTVDRMRFETPLALTLGAAGAFATFAAPVAALDAIPAGRPIAALLAAVALAPIAWVAMRPRRPTIVRTEIEPVEEEEPEPVVRMRRADLHPDAPLRQPIRASRDLGTPFMAVGSEADDAPIPEARFVEIEPQPEPESIAVEAIEAEAMPAEDEAIAPAPVAAEAIETETVETETVEAETVEAETVEAETVEAETAEAEPVAAPDIETDVEPEILATADIEPDAIAPIAIAPEPVAEAIEPETPRAQRQSLAAMMDRLADGVERRGGVPPRRPVGTMARSASQIRDVQPGLREALATLNRLAERR